MVKVVGIGISRIHGWAGYRRARVTPSYALRVTLRITVGAEDGAAGILLHRCLWETHCILVRTACELHANPLNPYKTCLAGR